MVTRRIWLITAIALLVACGDDDAASPTLSSPAPPVTTETTTVRTAPITTTTAPLSTTAPTPETSVVTTAALPPPVTASCSEAPAFDPDRPLRDQFVEYLVACGFTDPEAACLFDNLDFDDPAVLSGESDAMVPAFRACDIDIARMVEIGGA